MSPGVVAIFAHIARIASVDSSVTTHLPTDPFTEWLVTRRQNLAEKIAQLNETIDSVSSQLKSREGVDDEVTA